MRYAPEHKDQTRERILAEARRLFRRHGFEGVSLDAVMSAAGLTRGGFYKHFRSKADLFARALDHEADFVARMRAREGRSAEALREGALEVVRGYLHPDHREQVGRGCDLAALSVDVARAGKRARKQHATKLRELVAEFERGLGSPDTPDPRALTSVALCVGGLVLARSVDDEALAEALLDACEEAVAARLDA
ncbi:MAG: TetR/AcrR family transcriptional regulator [Myxococcota bacterium]